MFNIRVKEAIDKLSETEMGIHYLIIYADFQTLRAFYSQYTIRQIKENNESVIINPFYKTSDSAKKALYRDGFSNVFKHEKEDEEEALLIRDAFNTYFGQKPDRKFNERMINHVRQIGKKGISIMNEIGPFPFKGMFKRILDYELSLPSVFGLPLKLYCLFYQRDFDGFSFEQKTKLIEHHGMTIRIDE